MKQHISQTQLNELSHIGREKYWAYSKRRKWRKPNCDCDLWNIGQMIEFLDEYFSTCKLKLDWSICFGKDLAFVSTTGSNSIYGKTPKNREGELVDGLWELVKKIINREDKDTNTNNENIYTQK